MYYKIENINSLSEDFIVVTTTINIHQLISVSDVNFWWTESFKNMENPDF